MCRAAIRKRSSARVTREDLKLSRLNVFHLLDTFDEFIEKILAHVQLRLLRSFLRNQS
jgi:hypothetical protein